VAKTGCLTQVEIYEISGHASGNNAIRFYAEKQLNES